MKNRIFLILFSLLLLCPSLMAQRRRGTTPKRQPTPVVSVDSLLRNYDFTGAEKQLNETIQKKRRAKHSTLKEEEQLDIARKGQRMMSAVERVVVFDSLILPRQRVLETLPLSAESGKVLSSAALGVSENTDATGFLSEMGDQIIYANTNIQGILQLYGGSIIGGELESPQSLTGLDAEGSVNYNYPFMMADGTTLFYAKQGPESLGGYDIFMTRYDTEERRFLIPENIGMPFNSPANDYLYCVDESLNIGCFVSDRNCQGDSVCIFYFIPNQSRRVYIAEEVGNDALRQLAQLSNIRLTWSEESQVRAALARLQQGRQTQNNVSDSEFSFDVADNRTIRNVNQLNNPQAQVSARQWVASKANLKQLEKDLENKRIQWSKAMTAEKQRLAEEILQQEIQKEILQKQIITLENQVRRQELGL